MRKIRLFFLLVIAIIWFLVVVPYFLIQTTYGAKILSEQLSERTPFAVSIGSIHHSISQPFEIKLDNLVIKKKATAPEENDTDLANIGQLVMGLDQNDLWQFTHFNYLSVINGVINCDDQADNMITANTVKFINSTINFNFEEDHFSLQSVDGGIKPFGFTHEPYQFDLTAQTVLFDGIPLKSVLIQGVKRDGIMNITNIGGNIHNGFFVGKFKILPDNQIDISQIKLNNINFQSDIELNELNEFFAMLPNVTIRQFSLIDSSFSLPKFSIEKGNIEATNLSYDDDWHLNEGSIIFNADTAVIDDNLFTSPLIELHAEDNKVMIDKAIATWNKGNINATGSWQQNHLEIDQLIIAGVRYELPSTFNDITLPQQLNQITLNHLMILPSLIIGTDANHPFVFTNFELSGSDIDIVQDQKLGIYSGTLFFRAESGSYKGTDMKYPDLSVQFLSDKSSEFNFSTLLDQGMFETMAMVNPTQTQLTALKINAYNVNSNILTKWEFVKNPPNIDNFTADLHGDIKPFGLSGTISSGDNQYSVESQH